MIKVKVKSVRESKLEELTQDQFNKWDSARQQQWLRDHPNSKFKPQGQTKQDIASKYDASNDEDGTKWTGMNSQYKDKLVKDYEKAPDQDYEEPNIDYNDYKLEDKTRKQLSKIKKSTFDELSETDAIKYLKQLNPKLEVTKGRYNDGDEYYKLKSKNGKFEFTIMTYDDDKGGYFALVNDKEVTPSGWLKRKYGKSLNVVATQLNDFISNHKFYPTLKDTHDNTWTVWNRAYGNNTSKTFNTREEAQQYADELNEKQKL